MSQNPSYPDQSKATGWQQQERTVKEFSSGLCGEGFSNSGVFCRKKKPLNTCLLPRRAYKRAYSYQFIIPSFIIHHNKCLRLQPFPKVQNLFWGQQTCINILRVGLCKLAEMKATTDQKPDGVGHGAMFLTKRRQSLVFKLLHLLWPSCLCNSSCRKNIKAGTEMMSKKWSGSKL